MEMKKVVLCSLSLLILLLKVQPGQGTLVMPPTSPTRHQLIAGIGIPLQLENEAITLGLVLKAQYFLPNSANQHKFNFFPDIWKPYDKDFLWDIKQQKFPNGRRRREIVTDPMTGQKYERYEAEVNQIQDMPLKNETSIWESEDDEEEFDDQFEEDIQDKKLLREFLKQQRNRQQRVEEDEGNSHDLDLSLSRWDAYDALGQMLESKGFNGRMCVLRGICEAADIQFSMDETLMGELFHIFFTPSTTSELVSKSTDYDYIKAELIGKEKDGPACDEIFHQCKRSIMEIFTEIDDNEMFQFY